MKTTTKRNGKLGWADAGGWGVGPVGWANPGGLRPGFSPYYIFFLFPFSIFKSYSHF
jgi:hypothetical protein